MSRNTKLDTLGEKIKRRISTLNGMQADVESERRDIGSDLRHIWGAFEEAKKSKKPITVNGAKTKTEYAAFLGVDIRYCQYLVKDGSRKRSKNTNPVRVHWVKPGEIVGFGKRKFTVISIGDPVAPMDYEDADGVHSLGKEIADHRTGMGYTHDVQLNLKEIVEQTEEPEVAAPAPTKKLTADETRFQIECCVNDFRRGDTDDSSSEWAQRYGAYFNIESPKHPEWRPQQVEKELERIEVMIHSRRELKKMKTEARLAGQPETPVYKNEDGSVNTDIRVRLTSAQYREAGELARDLGIGWQPKVTLVFEADEYQEQAKALTLALEQRITDLQDGYKRWVKDENITADLLDWNNKEPAALAAKKEKSRVQGAIKACDGARSKIISGDLDSDGDDGRDLYAWQNARDEEQDRLYREKYEREWKEDMGDKPSQYLNHTAQKLAAAVDGADVPHGIAPEAVEVVKRMKARAALGLPQGDTCPTGDEDES